MTNGDCAEEAIAAAGIEGDLLSELPFLGDTWACRYLDELCAAGLMEREGDRLVATPLGRSVAGGHADRLAQAPIDRWLGGVHLSGRRVWRWDEATIALRAP